MAVADYITQELGDINSAHMEAVAPPSPADALVGRGPDEDWVPATVDAADVYMGAATMLSGEGGLEVLSPEALLSALEACGVDNARIEIEGGWEVPVVDGSSLGWVIAVQKAGVCEAAAGGDAQRAQRVAPNPQEMLTVRDGDAFVSFYPGEPAKVTAGVDHAGEADIIGRQWYTWGPGDSVPEDNYDNHYRWEVAPARKVIPSYEVSSATPLLCVVISERGTRSGAMNCG